MVVDHGELAGEDTAGVDVGCVRLEALVVSQDLRGGRGGHGRYEQRVAHPMLGNVCAQARPVVASAAGHLRDTPHVGLEDALGDGGARVRLVDSVTHGDVLGLGEGGKVDGFEDLGVDFLRLRGVEGKAEEDEDIGQALNSDTDGPVAHVAALSGLHGVEVDVDNAVEVAGYLACDLRQLLVIKRTASGGERAVQLLGLGAARRGGGVGLHDEPGQGNRGEVAHGSLFRGSELNNLSAQIGGADGAQVLLVGLAVARVLEKHVRVARLHLRLQDGEP
mmetsp:Transcript_29336/g.73212  ORF Transcript_29336/g.73212 Transcript_29336/m.73212 type:complete len:277 (+) Transcript_29336:1128-1958(+)